MNFVQKGDAKHDDSRGETNRVTKRSPLSQVLINRTQPQIVTTFDFVAWLFGVCLCGGHPQIASKNASQ
jgi:hypothetical protein